MGCVSSKTVGERPSAPPRRPRATHRGCLGPDDDRLGDRLVVGAGLPDRRGLGDFGRGDFLLGCRLGRGARLRCGFVPDLLRRRSPRLGGTQRRHLGGELGRGLAPGALARLGRVAGERAAAPALRRRLRRPRRAREPAGELLPLGLRARQLGLELLDLGVLLLERAARTRRSRRGRRVPAEARRPARAPPQRPLLACAPRCASRARGRCWPARAPRLRVRSSPA